MATSLSGRAGGCAGGRAETIRGGDAPEPLVTVQQAMLDLLPVRSSQMPATASGNPIPPTDRPNPKRLRRAAALAAATLALGVAAACGTSSGKSAAPNASTMPVTSSAQGSSMSSPADQAAAMIHISTFKFEVPASVSPGAMVSVMNMDGEAHTVTADSANAFDVKAIPGTTVTFKAPMVAGSYPFHCTYHSNMHGVLVVK
jgi:plastocyanin